MSRILNYLGRTVAPTTTRRASRVQLLREFDVKALCVTLEDGCVRDPWLTLNHEYQVLSILMAPKGPAKLRILADDGRTPILAEATMFAMSSQPLPQNWVASVREGGVVELGPAPWLVLGFWERYFNGEADAVAQFHREMHNIVDAPAPDQLS